VHVGRDDVGDEVAGLSRPLPDGRLDTQIEAGAVAVAAIDDAAVVGQDVVLLAVGPDVLAELIEGRTLHEREEGGDLVRFQDVGCGQSHGRTFRQAATRRLIVEWGGRRMLRPAMYAGLIRRGPIDETFENEKPHRQTYCSYVTTMSQHCSYSKSLLRPHLCVQSGSYDVGEAV
jgi:hypothetical protein